MFDNVRFKPAANSLPFILYLGIRGVYYWTGLLELIHFSGELSSLFHFAALGKKSGPREC